MSGDSDPKKKRSATCQMIIDEFLTCLRSDELIDNAAVDRLQLALNKHTALKVDDIQGALFTDPGEEE